VAGSLASARTSSVGVLVPTIANSIFSDTVQGLSDRLEPLGYAVILAQSSYDAAREDRMLTALLARRTDAIMMVGCRRHLRRTAAAARPHSRGGDVGPASRSDRCGSRASTIMPPA